MRCCGGGAMVQADPCVAAPMPPFGVYVHFPWCAVRCPYCDFAVATGEPPQERYTRAVLAELELRAAGFSGLDCRSLYLGGGTPSLWDPERVAEVVAAVRGRRAPPRAAEVTLEANPESCQPARLAAYAAAGVNRFSIGVQSFDPGVLAKLGRRHGPDLAERALRAAAANAAAGASPVARGRRCAGPGERDPRRHPARRPPTLRDLEPRAAGLR